MYTPITYTITYVNKFDTTHNNRTTFTVETETFILSKPNGKTGYICSGWTNGDDFVTLVEKGTCENLTLEAVWTPIQYYAEFYVDDKHSCTVEFTVEDSVLPYSPPVPAKEGYKGEWSAYTLDAENIRIDAVYTLETYTITYGNLNGRENTNVTSYNILSDDIILSELPSDENSEFLGWYTSDGRRVTKIPKGSYGNINLTAIWTGKCSIMFEADGGTPIPNSVQVLSGEKIQKPSIEPTKAGYTFSGWYYGDNKWHFDTDTVTEKITLKAHWEIITYTATFYADGHIYTVNFTVNDSSITEPDVPNKNGYSGKWNNYNLTLDNISIYAIYTPIQYTITYNGIINGATNTNPTSYNVETNTIVLAPLTLSPYTFIGWENESGVIITHIPIGTTGNITLNAVFEIDDESAIFILQNTEDGCVIIGCNNPKVTSITIPAYVTKVQSNAFKGCISLTSVIVENSSTVIEENAFWGCISLKEISVNGTATPIKTCYTYEEYKALDYNTQLEYYNYLKNDFFTWFNNAKKEYEDAQNREEIKDNNDDKELN